MKKILLTLLLGVAQLGFAQLTCATSSIATVGTNVAPAITGTYVTSCDTTNGNKVAPKGIWYSFTPSANGQLSITSNLPANDGNTYSDDTRVSVFTGTCGSLTCVAGNDDINADIYLSTVNVTVTAGTTYYIEWDDRWSALGFEWTLAFTSCLPPTALSISAISTTTATLTWTAPTPAPSTYNIEYGPIGFTQGTGTIASTATPTYTFPAQAPGSNISFYLRSNCGANQGSWMGPYNIFLVKNTPYSNSFDDTANRADGFVPAGNWALAVDAPGVAPSQSPTGFYYSNNSATAASNSQLYSRPLSLVAGATNTATFYTRLYAFEVSTGVPGVPSPMTMNVYINTTRSLTGATQIGTAITTSGTTHVLRTVPFTVPTTGNYYMIFSNNTPVATGATNTTALIFDTFAITSNSLAVNDIASNDANISVYPNPTSDILNIRSKEKVNSVSVYDIAGRKIDVKLKDNTVNVKSLQSGTYIITVETSKGKISEKFIKK
ncbi:T9SS type A sorting domain-containing protein [Chryseobacterium sp.]|uniref:T9SS type A sorting domain-containing protein n=1 Tax=Chryseobacterium sp. TaxID=1871047 RepID=UPI0011CC613F|nr:T9SS type A sorting domain-containing protein [Chryseobacterium sp.]TXF79100.1 T9SS type A sorting domain-containing protein [Chryseobacterium sp.]